jgi:hypothetical protein
VARPTAAGGVHRPATGVRRPQLLSRHGGRIRSRPEMATWAAPSDAGSTILSLSLVTSAGYLLQTAFFKLTPHLTFGGRREHETIAHSLFPTIKNAILLACVLATQSLAQNGPAFRSNVETVVVPLTVVDANGVAVGNLTRDEFHVYDNDVRRPIENLWSDNDLPLTLGSSSTRARVRKTRFRNTARPQSNYCNEFCDPAIALS